MQFRIAMNNVSGIKEYVIQLLKKQISYRELFALDHVSFNVYKGEVVGIIGTNGSGKSTLLKIVSGALKPSSGEVQCDRRKVQLLTLGTGFDVELTAKENVYLNGAIIGYSKEFIDSKYDEIVRFAELEGFMEEKVKNFSSGMVSRLGFAIATIGETAEILILDEVLSVGDEFFRKKSLKRVKEMIHGGATVLIVSHDMNTIIENCSKVVWIEKGKLKMIGESRLICKEYRKMNE
ncbi:MAG: ABC transporter ATP-binding protein [Roseburia sp.]|nr:ABC transporter ATP-binding protein [Roseburia sp.]